ncbi:MAG: caspase family protein [Bacteroidetes bacterium]|nr:caspase family protein [Bacteroidota bacterium]
MKKYCFSFVLLVFSLLNTYGQVTSPRVIVKDFQFSNDRIEVNYGFENCNPSDKYIVWIEASTESGKILKTKSLFGDISSVSPSPDKKLIWFTSRDSINVEDKIFIKVFASKQPEKNLGKAYLFSTLYPGAGHRQAGGKNKLYLGAIGYAGIAGAFAFNGMAATALSSYATATTDATEKTLMSNAAMYQTLSLSCIGVSAAVWALDYFLLSRTSKKSKNLKPGEFLVVPDTKNLLEAKSQTKFISTRGLPPNLFAELSFTDANGNGILEANEKAEMTITISNQGKGIAYDLNVNISDDKIDKSFKIGKIQNISLLKPNESKKITFPITTDIDLKSAEHKMQINVTEKYGYDMDPAFLVLQSFEYQTAKLAFSGLEILDAGEGTAAITEDGQLQAGEMVKAKIVVQNTGQGISSNTIYNISTTDNNIFLRDNSGTIGTLNPGETKEIYITLSPNKRVTSKDNLPVFLELKEELGKGNLTAFQLPVKLNQKPPKTNIVTMNKDVASLTKNIARFEYTSKKFSANASNVMNIKSVIPSQTKRKNSVAVVFGVSKYDNIVPAPYADNDAEIMKEYFEKVLGIEQVLLFTNNEVSISKINKVFNPDYGELQKAVVKGETEVFVFYSGHGIPDKTGDNTYLFPYDGVKEDLLTYGYNTTKLYENLCKLEAKSVTVILDACFSGSSRMSEKIKDENLVVQKGVKIKPKNPWLNNPSFTMINSSTGEETSLGFDPSETGLFTYYFCAGLQGKADENGDKKITMGELKRYVISKVTENSKKIFGLQTPEFAGDENKILVEY